MKTLTLGLIGGDDKDDLVVMQDVEEGVPVVILRLRLRQQASGTPWRDCKKYRQRQYFQGS